MAARSVLAGVADATPKSGKGEVEMIRMLKSARDSAVKARTQAGNQMKALVVTAPDELREALDGLTTSALVKRCRNFRISCLDDPKAAAKYALRLLACRHQNLSNELHCRTWMVSWNLSLGQSRLPWSAPLVWGPTQQQLC